MKTNLQTEEGAFACRCGHPEHQMIFRYNKEHDLVYCNIYVSGVSFWQRLKQGLQYIFGYRNQYGHWDEFIFRPEHAGQLQQLADALRPSLTKNRETEKDASALA